MRSVRLLSLAVLGASALLFSGAAELPVRRTYVFEGEREKADPSVIPVLIKRAATWPALPEAARTGPQGTSCGEHRLPGDSGRDRLPARRRRPSPTWPPTPSGTDLVEASRKAGLRRRRPRPARPSPRLTDGGRQWRRGQIPGLISSAYPRASDPWVAFGPGGRVYYASLLASGGVLGDTEPRSAVVVSSSSDGGETWGDPVGRLPGTQRFPRQGSDHCRHAGRQPLQGPCYVAWMTIENGYNLRVASSSDDGQTFSPAVTVRGDGLNFGIIPLVGPGGVVHAVWQHATRLGPNRYTDFRVTSARSEDGGATWSTPVDIAVPNNFDVPDLRTGSGLVAAAIDSRNGNLYVTWEDDRFSPGISQVVLSRSTDGGRTWSAPKLVSTGHKKSAELHLRRGRQRQGRSGRLLLLSPERPESPVSRRHLHRLLEKRRPDLRTRTPGQPVHLRHPFRGADLRRLLPGRLPGARRRPADVPSGLGGDQPEVPADPADDQPDVFTRAMKP